MTNKNKIINQAQKFIQKGQWDKAVKELQKLVAEDPTDVRTLLKLGDVFAKKGDRDQATKVYKQVAASYGEQGFFLKAVAVYKQILKHDPKHLEVTLKLAELYEHLGLTSEAMVQYQIAAQMHDEAGNVIEALNVLKRMVDLDGDNVASRIKLAESFSREHRIPEAIEQFQRAAEILKRHNRIEDYIKVAERLVYHDPNRLEVIKELAQIYLQRNDTKRGLAKLQLCFKAAPRDTETLNLLAGAFHELGQVEKTVYVLRELARIHHDNGQDSEARTVAQKILEIDPNDADARAALGYPTAPGSRLGSFQGAGLSSAQMFGQTGMMPAFGGQTGAMPAYAVAAAPTGFSTANNGFGVATGAMAAHPAPSSFGSNTGPQAAHGGPPTFIAGTVPQGVPASQSYPPMPSPGASAHPGFGVATGAMAAHPYPGGPQAQQFGSGTGPMASPGFGTSTGPQQTFGSSTGPLPVQAFGVATGPSAALPSPSASSGGAARGPKRTFEDPSERHAESRPSPAAGAAPASAAPKSDNPQVTKILTETDVYIKYGLRDKAIEHVRRAFEIEPDSVAAYSKMRDIYLSAGDSARAAEMVANLIQIHSRRGDAEALRSARSELERLAPGHPLVSGIHELGEDEPVTTGNEEFDSIDITEASDTYDARELRAAAAPSAAPAAPAEHDAVDAWLQQDPGFDESSVSGDVLSEDSGFVEEATDGHRPTGARPPEMQFGAFEHEVSSVSIAEIDILGTESTSEQDQGETTIEEGAEEHPDPFGLQDGASVPTNGASHFASSAPPHGHQEPPPARGLGGEYAELGLPTEEEANELPEASSGIIMLEGVSYADELLDSASAHGFPSRGFGQDTSVMPSRAAGDAAQAGLEEPPQGQTANPLTEAAWYAPLDSADPEEAAVGSEPLSFQSPLIEAPRSGGLSDEEKQKIEDELDEAEFLAGEGLREEALEAIASVLARVTGHPRAVALRALIESGALGGDADEGDNPDDEETAEDDGDAGDDGGASTPAEAPGDAQEVQSFGDVSDDELADAFDLGTPEASDGSNPEDHYDEAMAYKELGRIDDAIEHFRLAAKSESRAIPALEMIGHCLLAKNDYEGAIHSFYGALERGVEGPAAVNLKFEIAAAYEAAGDGEQAVNWFRSCYADDPSHRDVRGRLASLGVDPSEAETPNPHMNGSPPDAEERPVSKKNKISYL